MNLLLIHRRESRCLAGWMDGTIASRASGARCLRSLRSAMFASGWLITLASAVAPAVAQITAGGLSTRVNGSAFGSCTSGRCTIHGGEKAGSNLFYRTSNFDTRNGIRDVIIQSQNKRNIFFSVIAKPGSFINKPIELTSNANLFWISPGGITIGQGAAFLNAANLLLTTSSRVPFGKLGNLELDVRDSSGKQILDLDQEPTIDFDQFAENQLIDGKGLIGSGSINLEGGLINVERNLLIDATSGSLRLGTESDLTLKAGDSIRLRANQLAVNDSQLLAGERGRGGLIDLQAVATGDGSRPGILSVTNSAFEAQRILLSGNQVGLDQTWLKAPKGWIQLAALATPKISNSNPTLSITRSSLDVSPSREEHLSSVAMEPLTKLEGNQTGSSTNVSNSRPPRVPYPVIALISDGEIEIGDSKLNASFDLSKLSEPLANAAGIDFWRIADRSGLVLISAAKDILLDRVNLSVNASHNKAGVIIVKSGREKQDDASGARRIISKGKLGIQDSQITANGGAGNGIVVLRSNDGIAIDGSLIDTSNNRFPLVAGRAFGEMNGYIRPYVFHGGRIVLDNISADQFIRVSSSRLLSATTSDGGGLESPLFSTLTVPTVNKGDVFKIGLYGNLQAFNYGQDSNTSGGSLFFYSQGGIAIQGGTVLDVSGGFASPENISGFISMEDRSGSGIVIDHSSIRAVTGFPLDPSNRDLQTGKIWLDAKSEILLSSASIDASSTNTIDLTPINLPADPQVWISSEAGLIALNNVTLNSDYFNLFDPSLSLLLSHEPFVSRGLTGQEPTIFYEYLGSAGVDISSFESIPSQELLDRANEVMGIPVFSEEPIRVAESNEEEIPLAQSFESILSPNEAQAQASASLELDPSSFSRTEASTLTQIVAALGLPKGSGRVRSMPELQQALSRARSLGAMQASPVFPALAKVPGVRQTRDGRKPGGYVPAILQLRRDDQANGSSRITAIVLRGDGPPISRSTTVASAALNHWIRRSQQHLSRRSLDAVVAPREAQSLARTLLDPIAETLLSDGTTALLLSVDRGLQGIPYAVLPFNGQPLAERFALTVTPSLGLIDLDPSRRVVPGAASAVLLAGATQFSNGLAPLPMVKAELQTLSSEQSSSILLNDSFTPQALVQQAQNNSIRRLHIATHANFKPGSLGLLYTAKDSLSLKQLGRALVFRNSEQPLDLISLSGCLTALGDEDSELGFVGMALQAGARSGIGTLWEVDDIATAAFFIQFYRYLQQGLSKDLALQATQRAFLQGVVRLEGNQLVGPTRLDGSARAPLVSGLSREDRQLFAQGLSHPYYWAGMVLTGSPW